MKWKKKLKPQYQFNGNAKQYNTRLLNDTTLKRACCMGSDFVNVRIPSYTGAKYNLNLDEGKIAKANNYVDVRTKVNRASCPAGFNDATTVGCQSFYRVYCTGILQEFIDKYWKDQTKPFPYTQWVSYKKECACFSPDPEWMKNFQFNIPPKCVIPDCLPGGNAFLDDESQGTACQNLTYCQQNLDIGTVAAIEGSSVDVGGLNLVNNCGQNSALAKSYNQAKQQLASSGTKTSTKPSTTTTTTTTTPSSPPSESTINPTSELTTDQTSESTVNTENEASITSSILLPIGASVFLLCCIIIIIIAVIFYYKRK